MWFSWGKHDLGRELRILRREMRVIVSAFQEALAGWTGYANELKAQNSDLRSKLEAAQSTLDDWAAIDAAEDAAQAAALQQRLADQLAAALEAVKNPPQEPELPDEPEEPGDEPADGGDEPTPEDPPGEVPGDDGTP